MAHFEARMSSKGQLTVPSGVRQMLELGEGDTVDFFVDDATRTVRIRARNKPIETLFGVLNDAVSEPPMKLTDAGSDAAIGEALAGDDARIMQEYREWEAFQKWRKSRRRNAAE